MNALTAAIAAHLEEAPDAAHLADIWSRGLITLDEATRLLMEARKNADFWHVIQYQTDTGARWKDYTDTQYSYSEARDELSRLRDAAPGFRWRTRTEYKYI